MRSTKFSMEASGGGVSPEGSVGTCMLYGRLYMAGILAHMDRQTQERSSEHAGNVASLGAGGSKTPAATHRRPLPFVFEPLRKSEGEEHRR